jgi:hypothetical protein
MKIVQAGLLVFLFMSFSACYSGIKGTVVDDATGKPIEGAVIAVQWNKTEGAPGLTYGVRVKTDEAVTDENGKFFLTGSPEIFVDPPILVVYKEGYFAWISNYIYQESSNRTDFKWKSGKEYRLEKFIKGYSHDRHIGSFSTDFIISGCPNLDKAVAREKALGQKESMLYGKKRRDLTRNSDEWKKLDAYSQGKLWEKIWKETLQELYFPEEGDKNE